MHCRTDLDSLVKQMVEKLNSIAESVHILAEESWGTALEALKEQLKKYDDVDCEEKIECDDDDDDAAAAADDDNDDERMQCGENAEQKGRRSVKRKLKTLYGQLTSYMTQIPVLGFNSSKYDLNLIKKKLAFHLHMHEAEGGFVVKRNNAYTCMSSDSLKFLDVSQYLAPGTSYAKFLKAYNVEEGKGHFPYEWFDDVTKLDVTSLPPHGSFLQ